MFQDVYTLPGVGNLIHSFLSVDDDLRTDCVSKPIREFHRKHVYSRITKVDTDQVMSESETNTGGVHAVRKFSRYATEIVCYPNSYDLKLPPLRAMPGVKKITYAIPMVVDVTHYEIMHYTDHMWGSVETMLSDVVSNPQHPLEDLVIVTGNMWYVRTDPETGEELESYEVTDREEYTHCTYYRKFGFNPIYIPYSLYRTKLRMYLPRYVVPFVSQEQHANKFTYWSEEYKPSLGRLLLDFH
jgi:hypothetical protein